MSLKRDIVIVNEFSVKGVDGKGSRGSTPGDYATRYMARFGAVEDLTPVFKKDNNTYIMRYMARATAVESLEDKRELVNTLTNMDGLSGVAFSKDSVSLSEERLKILSKEIQDNFDKGKTVFKTVISFDGDYLKKYKILPEDFKFKERGDFRGHIDQMKLRMSIRNGLSKMEKDFDDLLYVGVIQVDTAHVHCHLAMVDRGVGNTIDGVEQKGKLLDKHKSKLRRGIDAYLDVHGKVAYLSNNVNYDKRNLKSFVRRFTHNVIKDNGDFQLIVAALPDDKSLWRAKSNSKAMKKANSLCKSFVKNILEQNDLYDQSLSSIKEYADYRLQNEGLKKEEYERLLKNGEERVINECMNTVYGVIKSLDGRDFNVNTPMINVMSIDIDDLVDEREKSNDDFLEFAYKLRSYSSRLNYHKNEKDKYRKARKEFEEIEEEKVSDDARVIHRLLMVEELYNEMCMAKYQHFLPFYPLEDVYDEELEAILAYKESLENLKRMRDDKSMKNLTPQGAENYGMKTYNQTGGRYQVIDPGVLDKRYKTYKDSYDNSLDDFKSFLSDNALSFDDNTGEVIKKPRYEFKDVKAFDLHHLTLDFKEDIPISKANIDNFLFISNLRAKSLKDVKDYLEKTDQLSGLKFYQVKDIELMDKYAEKLRIEPIIENAYVNKDGKLKKIDTVAADDKYKEIMRDAIIDTVNDMDFDDLEV